MKTAIWIIAICEVIRAAQNALGRIDVIDKLNCAKIVALLESQRSSQGGDSKS